MGLKDIYLTDIQPWKKNFRQGLTAVLIKGGFTNERGEPSITVLMRVIAAAGYADSQLTADVLAALRDNKSKSVLDEYSEAVATARKHTKESDEQRHTGNAKAKPS